MSRLLPGSYTKTHAGANCVFARRVSAKNKLIERESTMKNFMSKWARTVVVLVVSISTVKRTRSSCIKVLRFCPAP